ncbi:MAG TPA: beta-galactosidase, partial [Opitutus sp.]|nr:beta-galactosidase [Opitutus sp.]
MKKLFHGVCYYPELWPETEIDRDIAEMKRVGINFVRMGEFAWSRIEPEEGRISLDFFVGVMDRLHAAEIGVVLCTPTPTPPVWLTHGHPERCFVDADGNVMGHGARQHASYENPDVRAACLRIVEACSAALGKHPALVAWQIDNEFKCHVAEDFNPSAVAHWHGWLKNKYGTIERLNAAWGADIWSETYQRFEQVPAPRKTPFLHNASLSTAYRMFSRESIAAFMDAQCAVLRKHSAAPITHNFGLEFSVNFERMSEGLDFVSFDDYP